MNAKNVHMNPCLFCHDKFSPIPVSISLVLLLALFILGFFLSVLLLLKEREKRREGEEGKGRKEDSFPPLGLGLSPLKGAQQGWVEVPALCPWGLVLIDSL